MKRFSRAVAAGGLALLVSSTAVQAFDFKKTCKHYTRGFHSELVGLDFAMERDRGIYTVGITVRDGKGYLQIENMFQCISDGLHNLSNGRYDIQRTYFSDQYFLNIDLSKEIDTAEPWDYM